MKGRFQADRSRNKQFHPLRMPGPNTDITERKPSDAEINSHNLGLQIENLNHALSRREEQLEAACKDLESFSFSVSHELRTPLQAISGFAQILQQSHAVQLNSDGQACVQYILEASQRMDELIDDMMILSRVAQIEIRHDPVDLSRMAECIAARLQCSAPQRQVHFTITAGAHVRGEVQLLRIMLDNLFANAWKYTARRKAAQIEFGNTRIDGKTVFFVRDNGAGFDLANAARLFTPFQRLHDNSEFPGSGIGLATVQRIIHRHGGRVWADGEVGRGATFYFTIADAHDSPRG